MKFVIREYSHEDGQRYCYFEWYTEQAVLQSNAFVDTSSCRGYLENLQEQLRDVKTWEHTRLERQEGDWWLIIAENLRLKCLESEYLKGEGDQAYFINELKTAIKRAGEPEIIDATSDSRTYPSDDETTDEPSPPSEYDPNTQDDYLLDDPTPGGTTGWETYHQRQEGRRLHYFHLNDEQGRPLLFSEGYSSARSRDHGLKLVADLCRKRDNYHIREEEGKYYCVIRAANNREIARSRSFDSLQEMESCISRLCAALPELPPEAPPAERDIDDYNPDHESQSGEGGFEIFEAETEKGICRHYFHLNDAEGEALLISEAYHNRTDRDKGLRSVINNAPSEENFRVRQEAGKYFLCLIAANGQEIAISRSFPDHKSAMIAIQKITAWACTWDNDPPAIKEVVVEKGEDPPYGEREREDPPQDPPYGEHEREGPPQDPPYGEHEKEGPPQDPPYGEREREDPPQDPPYVGPEVIIPSIPDYEPETQPQPCEPVFKPLSPLEIADLPLFWGRQKEVEDLYRMSFDTALLLLFGAPGIGKTSLVRCGLANKFSPTRWQEIDVVRGDDINESLLQALQAEQEKLEITESSDNPLKRMEAIHRFTFKPIYLIFDDLETLFQDADNEEERQCFFTFLRDLVDSGLPFKAVLIIDESKLANLWNYEPIVPSLFTNRYRVEGIPSAHIGPGLEATLDRLGERGWQVPEPDSAAERVLKKLEKDRSCIEPACLQIYLHQLQQWCCENKNGAPPTLDISAVEKAGTPKELIADYLKEQRTVLKTIEEQTNGTTARELRKNLNNARFRCQDVTTTDVVIVDPEPPPPPPPPPNPWWYWLGWIGLVFLLLLFFWPDPEPLPCTGADGKLPQSCEEYIAYIRSNSCTDSCSATYLARLKEMGCLGMDTEINDYFITLQENDCDYYSRYIRRYGSEGVCYQQVLDLAFRRCQPVVPATICNLNSCDDYRQYLADNGNDGPCSNYYLLLLETECNNNCPATTCEEYRSYLDQYGEDGECSKVYQRRLERECIIDPEECDLTSCEAYRRYLDAYGTDGECSERYQRLWERNCLEPKGCALTTCEEYRQYLAEYGEDGPCSRYYLLLLRDQCGGGSCDATTCEQYRRYLRENGEDGRCSPLYRRLLAAECAPPPPPSCPRLSCEEYMAYLDNNDSKSKCWDQYVIWLEEQCGIIYTYPLYIWPRQDNLHTWEEALGACPRGWRLPCLGEVNYFNDNYEVMNYGDYVISFWTATESDDSYAWSVRAGGSKLVPMKDTSKPTRLPCLCVRERPTYPESDIRRSSYPCYVKSIRGQ